MAIRNKVLVSFLLERGCSQEDGEVEIRWKPINFEIYSDLFPELISHAMDEWISDNKMKTDVVYEVIFSHIIEHDGAGAIVGEHFEQIHQEAQFL